MSVSAVLPVYNGAQYVAEAIESVYAQTVLPTEVIVVDDGSTDGTPRIIEQFEGRPGFRSVRTPNGGPGSARNVGVEQATGEYVAFLDHDDLWRPTKLERQLAEFEPTWGMSFTAYERTNTTTSGVTTSELTCHESWDPEPRAVISRLARSSATGTPSTVLVKRDALHRVGPFEDVSFGEDWLMWLRFARAGNPVGYLAEPLTEYRWHGENRSKDEHGAFFDCACQVFDLYGDRRLQAWWRLLAAIDAHERKDGQGARQRIFEAARIRPWSVRPGWAKLLF
jgi:glycosyltransferase involved in cell wall biosynthesis